MIRFIVASVCFLFYFSISAQQNMSLVSNVGFSEDAADIWGYVDANNVEYAIIGTRTAARVFSLETPSSPTERIVINGDASLWRDIKSFGNYIYSIRDSGNDGLLIIDMSGAPTNITYNFWRPSLTVDGITTSLNRGHNLYIDESGYLYISGSNIGVGGVLIFDLFTTPGTPIHVGETNARYSHDVYTRGNLMYSSEINAGHFAIYDVTDRANPSLLATQTTGRSFTHNAWLSDDGNILYTTDERSNAYIESYDVSDPSDIQFLDRWRPTISGTGVIPHNVHVLNDFLVISQYRDGVIIVDAAQPDNLIQVGQFDTYSGSGNGFNGCWGAYPFLPSGLVLASDIESGLYVFSADYIRASYFRGEVVDAQTGNPIADADINVVGYPEQATTSGNFGEFATGIADSAEVMVITTATGYATDTIMVTLSPGVTAQRTIFLGACTADRQLTGTIAAGAVGASNSITVNNATLPSPNVATWQANTVVALDSNVTIELGAELLVGNDGCD